MWGSAVYSIVIHVIVLYCIALYGMHGMAGCIAYCIVGKSDSSEWLSDWLQERTEHNI